MPICIENQVGKYSNQNFDPYLQPSSISHDIDPMKEALEWFMKPMVKPNLSIPQDGIDTHKSRLEYDLDACHPLSSLSHDLLPLDLLDKSLPNPSIDQEQGSHISLVEDVTSSSHIYPIH